MFFTRKLYPLFFFAIIFATNSEILIATRADSILNGVKFEANAQYGFILPHHEGIKYIVDRNIMSFDLCLTTESNYRNLWEELYRFPRYGFGYNFKNFGNELFLGKAHSLYAFIDIPIKHSENGFFSSYSLEFGPTLINKFYDNQSNPLNQAISKNLNVYVGLEFLSHYKVKDKYEILLGLQLTHYSNGKVRTPNMGLNTISLSTGLTYDIVGDYSLKKKNIINSYPKHTVDFICGFGYKRDDFLNEKLFLTNSIIADYNYFFTPKYAFGGGLDYFYDASIGVNKENLDEGIAEKSDNYRAGAHLSLTARYNKLSLLIGFGRYFYCTYYRYSYFYNRLGIRYAISNKLVLNLSLKAHYAIADFVEWGVGYRFNFYN